MITNQCMKSNPSLRTFIKEISSTFRKSKEVYILAAIKEIASATAVLSEQAAFELLRSGKLEHYDRMLKSDDALEGARAFNEKRPPVWRGR